MTLLYTLYFQVLDFVFFFKSEVQIYFDLNFKFMAWSSVSYFYNLPIELFLKVVT